MKQQTDNSPLALSRTMPEHQQAVSLNELAMMMVHAVRCRDVFAETRRLLTVDLFDSRTEGAFAVMWAAINHAYDHYGQLNPSLLLFVCQSLLQAEPSALDPRGRELLFAQHSGGLLFFCFTYPEEQLVPELGRELLRRFLYERRLVRPMQQVLQSAGHDRSYLKNILPTIEAAMEDGRRIETLREAPLACVMPVRGSLLPAAPLREPLGINFVDSIIGGQRAGDCNGILGVFGSGKTTFGIQLAVTTARNYYSQYQPGQPPKMGIFLSYEEPETKVNPRIWACAANIPRTKLEQLMETQNWGLLTTQETIEPYERRLSGNGATSGEICLSETERWDVCSHWLNKHFITLDMSGSEKYKGAGKGFVPEIRAILERVVSERNCQIGTVVIDYAGLVCRRYMESQNINNDQLRHYLGRMGDQLRQQVAEYFGGTVWLLHQFNGDQNQSSPSKLLHHSDAAESKAFAENMAVCGCLGVRDRNNGALMLNWSKIRYAAAQTALPPRLIIDGDFSRLVDVSHQFVLSETGGGFVDPSTQRALHDGGSPQPGSLRRLHAMPTTSSVAAAADGI